MNIEIESLGKDEWKWYGNFFYDNLYMKYKGYKLEVPKMKLIWFLVYPNVFKIHFLQTNICRDTKFTWFDVCKRL